ncbi:MAG: peptidase U34 [Myxococcota bacterium]
MCDTVVVVQPDGVLFAKNSDRDPNEAQLLEWHPAREHAAGSTVRCTHVEIPQVARTHATLLSRPFWMWGAEIGANEHGVIIGNEAVFTREPYARTGLTGMDLLRLALERAADRHQALDVITTLLKTHGQGGGCGHEDRAFTYHNSFIVADRRGATVLETAGAHWATEEVRGARGISNGLTIPGFAEKHSDWLKTTVSACAVRRARTQSLAQGATGVGQMMSLLRDHGAHGPWPDYAFLNGAMSAPCMHGGGIAASSQTTSSWVARLRPDGDSHWVTGTAAPCTSLFKPVRVAEPMNAGTPTDVADDSLWWRHEALHRAVMCNPAELLPLFSSERDALEQLWVANPPSPAQAFAEGNARLTEWTRAVLSRRVEDVRPVWVRRYWSERDRRAQRPLTVAA